MGRSGRTPLDEMALDSLGNHEVISRVQQEALDASLLALFSTARTGLEEGGANTLYLALGMLLWREADRADIRWTNITLAEINGGQLTPPLQAELRSNRSGKYTFQATKLSYGRAR